MKIKIEVDIFDDGDLCASDDKYCSELYREDWVWFCHLFKQQKTRRMELVAKLVKFDWGSKQLPVKCDECKAAYQQHINKG